MIFNLHIDRLVLDGITLTPHQRNALQTTVQSELGRLVIASGIDSGILPHDSKRTIRGGSIHIGKNNTAPSLGKQVAGAVYRGIMGNELRTGPTDR